MTRYDHEIKNDVLNSISQKRVKALRVDVYHGFVVLSGSVPANASRNDITRTVLEIDGVISVRNKIRCRQHKKFQPRYDRFLFNP